MPRGVHQRCKLSRQRAASHSQTANRRMRLLGQPYDSEGAFHHILLTTTLDDLVGRRLVVESDPEEYALPHHLLRETLLHRLSQIRRRMIHRQLAEAYEARLEAQADVSVRPIALHAVAGEDIDRARRYGLQVLNDLPQDYSAAETVGFFQQLHDLLAHTASREEMLR